MQAKNFKELISTNKQVKKHHPQLANNPQKKKTFLDILKFNPYHDRLGRFATSGSATSFTYAPGKSKAHDRAIEREKAKAAATPGASWSQKMDEELNTMLGKKSNEQAEFLYDSGMLSMDAAVEAMNNGTTQAHIKNYFAIMKENGEITSTKPLSDNPANRNRDVTNGKYSSHDEAKKGYIKEKTGMDDTEAAKVSKELTTWTSNSWDAADTATIDKFIEKDHTYKGEIYRGMIFSDSDYKSFMQNVDVGSVISMKRNSSWSSNEDDAVVFSHNSQDDVNSVIIKCVKNRTSSPIAYINSQGEAEVIAHSKAKWTVLQNETYETRSGGKKTYLTVVEKGAE